MARGGKGKTGAAPRSNASAVIRDTTDRAIPRRLKRGSVRTLDTSQMPGKSAKVSSSPRQATWSPSRIT